MPANGNFSAEPEGWEKLFPENIPLPEDGTFELGLVLGGTVSAGAYSAGVMDFLIEALDCWSDVRAQRPDDASVPSWRTRINAMVGTSGGGVIAAILARALAYRFPHVRKSSPDKDCEDNPLYRIWVKQLDISAMLDVSDLAKRQPLASLLNAQPLEDARNGIARYVETFSPSRSYPRSYLAEPLPILLTLTNLRGIPYRLDMGRGDSQCYVDHADHVRVAAFTQGPGGALRPDEFGVSVAPGAAGYLDWGAFAEFALGTAAFPGGFPLRALARPLSHYRYRPVAFPAGIPGQKPITLRPVDWNGLLEPGSTALPDTYHFLAADGGMIDNEPIELCRKAISGWVGHNPRDGAIAKRGVLLIDPFAESPDLGFRGSIGLKSLPASLLSAWKDQARYDSRDLLLAADEKCFSRFMITARRPGAEAGSRSIACASAYAFGGFLSEAFRRHDFLLGRANCRSYLQRQLLLPIDNPLFADWRKRTADRYLNDWRVMDGDQPSLPIIPLLDDCRTEEQVESYPVRAFNVHAASFQALLEDRIDGVLDKIKDDIEPCGWAGILPDLYLSIGEIFGRGKLVRLATDYVERSLRDWKLL